MPKTITETKVMNYAVSDDADVVAMATIGDGQQGAWTMQLGAVFLKGGTNPVPVTIGKGKILAEGDPNLEVSATVKDIREETDRMTLTLDLKGGKKPATFEISNLGDPGDNASYSMVVRFI